MRSTLPAALALLAVGCHGAPPERAVPSAEAPLASPSAFAPTPAPPKAAPATIVISAIGDCTLGGDVTPQWQGATPFDIELRAHGDDLGYPFSGVLDVLAHDDLTIANLETTLTTRKARAPDAAFHFRGKPAYAQILVEGSVEVVNIANNHIDDFGAKGFSDTVKALKQHGVGVAGPDLLDRRVIKGVEIVNLGFLGGGEAIERKAIQSIGASKSDRNLVIVSFHWGLEGTSEVLAGQRRLGRAAIDAGADLVLGTHPHVLQEIEAYRGRHIVYSLGNFVFGGNLNPADKDAMIYQEIFAEEDGRYRPSDGKVIPVRISTAPDRNDFRPVLLDGEDRTRVLAKVKRTTRE